MLDRLVLMRLQVNKADEQGIRVSNAEVEQAVNGVAQQNKLTPDQLRAAVEQSGSSFAAFREQLATAAHRAAAARQRVRDSVQITDSEINNLLSSPTYKAGEVHLAHIQISIPSGGTAADIQPAQAKAQEAIKAIKGGMDFNAAAIRYSDAQDALDGGDLGWRRMDECRRPLPTPSASMKPGEITPALRGPTGFHILKLVGERQPQRQVVTEYHARQILISPSELVTPEQAQQKAKTSTTRIVNKHEDFAKLAKEDSKDDTTANIGGDMGWFAQDAWGADHWRPASASLKPDEVSQPFQSEAGWHIMQLLGTRQADRTDEIARNEARQAIGNRKAEQAYDDFLRDLRSQCLRQDPGARAARPRTQAGSTTPAQ